MQSVLYLIPEVCLGVMLSYCILSAVCSGVMQSVLYLIPEVSPGVMLSYCILSAVCSGVMQSVLYYPLEMLDATHLQIFSRFPNESCPAI